MAMRMRRISLPHQLKRRLRSFSSEEGESAGIIKPVVKRFYDRATVSAEAPWKVCLRAANGDLTWRYYLGSQATKKTLVLPNLTLATITAAEWDMADSIVLKYMPMTNMACVAMDRVARDRTFMEEQLMKFLHTDTICYRIDTTATETLYEEQMAIWDPLNEWFGEKFGGEPLEVTTGFGKTNVPAAATQAVESYIRGLCPWGLAALDTSVSATKSLVISLALAHGKLPVEEAVKASRLEEDWQIELYGLVEGGHDWDVASTKSLELEESSNECLATVLKEFDVFP